MIAEERTIGPNGQVVIPKKLRKALGLVPGKKVVFHYRDEKVFLVPQTKSIRVQWERLAQKANLSGEFDSGTEHTQMLEKRWKRSI